MNDDPTVRPTRNPSPWRNWLSLAGLVLSASAFFAFVLLFSVDLFSEHTNPYMGILAFVVAPAFLLLGLAMTVIGYVAERRRIRKARAEKFSGFVFHVDLTRQRDRRLMGGFIGASFIFLLLTAFGSYQTYHLMETTVFCGETCHTPMEPEFKAYQHSAHAQVDCVQCHIGPGTTAYIKVKINGVKQMYHEVLGDFERPIKILKPNLRLTEETCQDCHWSQKHFGDVPKTFRHFLADETNTPFTVQMILKLGGSDPIYGPVEGIHAHNNVSRKIEYISLDEKRLDIPWIRVTDANGKSTEYRTKEFKDDIAKHRINTMSCMDCHNRPAHNFNTPNDAVEQSMAFGRIDPSIPWVKSKVVKALVAQYADRDEANKKIASSLRAEYKDDKRVDAVIKEALAIYEANFFPEMKTDWRVHANFIGHKDTNGCFRCHAGKQLASDGKTSIKGNSCNDCHLIVAQGAGAELEKVNPKGFEFFHIDAEFSDPSCAECHNGQIQEE